MKDPHNNRNFKTWPHCQSSDRYILALFCFLREIGPSKTHTHTHTQSCKSQINLKVANSWRVGIVKPMDDYEKITVWNQSAYDDHWHSSFLVMHVERK